MARAPRYPNTQTPADRALWRKIKRQIRATRRRKKKLYGLSTNREADLYITPPQRATIASGKIIPFRIER
jgi:hypothetical protein